MTQSSATEEQATQTSWEFWLIALALSAGLILSIFSWLELCVEHCSANQDYLLFNFPFSIFGMLFFTGAIGLHLLSPSKPLFSKLLGWQIASAVGAEGWFIHVQKAEIGHWCPVCLSIAATIAFAASVLLFGFTKDKGDTMRKFKQGLTSLSFLVIGFLMAVAGISKLDAAAAARSDIKDKVVFGTKNSPVEVYFVSDWFCPSCKKIEPLIEKTFPKIKSKVAFYFIDYPIHKKSQNFSPYNLAFLVNDKPQYLKARQILINLTDKTDSPTDEDIEKVAKKEGLTFKELPYLEVKAGMDYFDTIVEKYKLTSTPTVIITNPKRNTVVKLEGRDEISEEKILKAIENLTPAK